MRRLSRNLLFCTSLLLPVWTFALPEDRDQPIQLEADSASFDQRSGVSEYSGHVAVSQGTMHLAADKATIIFDDNGVFQRMEASGNPTRFRYKPDHDKAQIDGVGAKIEYNVSEAKVKVSGGAQFTQGDAVFKGNRIVYDLTTDVVTADGKIIFIIPPNNK